MQGNPDSKKSLLVKSGMRKIVPCGIQNPENLCVRDKDSWVLDPKSNLRIRNPANILDSESKFLWQEIQDSAPETQNSTKKIDAYSHITYYSQFTASSGKLPITSQVEGAHSPSESVKTRISIAQEQPPLKGTSILPTSSGVGRLVRR